MTELERHLLQREAQRIEVSALAGPVYAITGAIANIGVIADPSGAVLIDTGNREVASKLREAIGGIPGAERIRIVVNTHLHWDHLENNDTLGAEAARFAQREVLVGLRRSGGVPDAGHEPLPLSTWPNITFAEALNIGVGGVELSVVHYPHAHSSGDSVVYVDDLRVAFLGDLLTNGYFPFLDVDDGGDIVGWSSCIESVLARLHADARIVPGHGPLATKPDLRSFGTMLSDSIEFVRGEMAQGRTVRAIQEAGLPESLRRWARDEPSGREWISHVYRSLALAD